MGELVTFREAEEVVFVSFESAGEEIGKLVWDKEGIRFTGNADEAAQLFFDCVIKKYVLALKELEQLT